MTTEELKPGKNEGIERSLVEDAKSGTLAISSPCHGDRRPVLTKQSSQKLSCLCSPTTHAGSFRCRLHRTSLRPSTGSVGSGLSELASRLRSRS
ncbi:hypothetical protein OPV22_009321 [Ensete ventricosum]|uniref:Uncharacterized protein n=1 Tax=Ensete ventricosum TaxID=4639 RepID=A0A426YD54_ENSVE|nr:hypothetical protein OPV22_009321 [Ensete ventricosum]RRT49658.1 hypothetical protein B296_00051646 [Ensete ventricosum]